MKRLILGLLLLSPVAPILANDVGGDGPYIPSYQELVREGFGPTNSNRQEIFYSNSYGHQIVAPKPTQAYYAQGYTIYYGYKPVYVQAGEVGTVYAFGYPVTYFRQMMGNAVTDSNLDHYAVLVRSSQYAPGDYIARNGYRGNAVTSVQTVKAKTVATTTTTGAAPTTAGGNGTAPLPPIGEKPSH